MTTRRIFLALTLDDASMAAVDRASGALPADRGFRLTRRGDHHATLVFLGEVDQGAAEREVFGAVAPRYVEAAPLELGTAVLSGFPKPNRATIAILRLADPGERIAALARIAHAAAKKLGVAVDERPFAPHVTLARHRSGFDLAPLSSRVGTTRLGRAAGLVLFASEGGRYVELRRA